MLRNFCILLSILLPLYSGITLANGDITAGKSKSVTCSACHGQDGNGVEALPMQPRLAGQHAEYTAKQLKDYQSKARENAIMAPMVAALSEEDINDISAYYASLKGAIGSSSPDTLEAGEKLYRAGNAKTGLAACMACHGPSGRGNPAAKYPSLNGQWSEYTKVQLMAFKSEARANDLNSVMRDVATKMSNEEIEAVSNYIQGLH